MCYFKSFIECFYSLFNPPHLSFLACLTIYHFLFYFPSLCSPALLWECSLPLCVVHLIEFTTLKKKADSGSPSSFQKLGILFILNLDDSCTVLQSIWIHLCNCLVVAGKCCFIEIIYYLWLLPSFSPLFLENPQALAKWCAIHFSFKAKHFTVSLSLNIHQFKISVLIVVFHKKLLGWG